MANKNIFQTRVQKSPSADTTLRAQAADQVSQYRGRFDVDVTGNIVWND